MKTLYKFILKSYIGPFILTFFISMFVFFMIFIYTYIDDFIGKGLSSKVLLELFFYFSLTTISMALPLAILLSSLMTFGNLGEHFELTAMKSSGISLKQIMKPLVGTTLVLSVLAFYFSNNILPYTNLKAGSLLYDIRSSKPALLFKDGVFNNNLTGFSIRIGKKEADNKTLSDILIYDHRQMHGNNIVVKAKSGEMHQTADKSFLVLTLKDGISYKETAESNNRIKTHPFIRDKFEEKVIRFDLSEFKLSRTNEELFKDNQKMLNLSQLTKAVDSLKVKSLKRKEDFPNVFKRNFYGNSINKLETKDTSSRAALAVKFNYFDSLTKQQKITVIEGASNAARNAKAYIESEARDIQSNKNSIIRYQIEWNRKFTLSFACLVLFFIGAPLGAIIRKGGLGMPVVISIIFFLSFHIVSISGEKLVKEEAFPVPVGMWMATVTLLPLGIFLTYKATADKGLLDLTSAFQRSEKGWLSKLIKKNQAA